MEIIQTFGYTKLESIPSGGICQIPEMGLDTLFMVVEPAIQDYETDLFTIIDISTGVLYRESELPDRNLTKAILVHGHFEHYVALPWEEE